MKGKTNKKQHFIPVCYLKGFSNDNKGLYIYDKDLNQSFPSALKNVGYRNNFYTINEKFVEQNPETDFDPDFYETEFFRKNIEKNYNEILIRIRESARVWLENKQDGEVMSQLDKDHFAAYIGIQFLRLPAVRENHFQAYKAAEDKRLEIVKAFVIAQNPELKGAGENLKLKHDADYGSVVHSWLFGNQKLIDDIQDVLLKKCWSFFVSENNELYTSDQPIVVIPRLEGQAGYFDGLGMRGAQIIFPVAGNILLSMWDAEFFDSNAYVQDRFQPMQLKEKNLNNLYQYVSANKQVYNGRNEFSLIAQILKENNGKPLYMPKPKIWVF